MAYAYGTLTDNGGGHGHTRSSQRIAISQQARSVTGRMWYHSLAAFTFVAWPASSIPILHLSQDIIWIEGHPVTPEWMKKTFLAYWIAYTVYFLTVVIQSIHRRHLYPFKARAFSLLLISSLSGYLFVAWASYLRAIATDVPCYLSKFCVDYGLAALVLPYIVRAVRLHMLFQQDKHSTNGNGKQTSCECRALRQKGSLSIWIISMIPFAVLSVLTSVMSGWEEIDQFACSPTMRQTQMSRLFWAFVDGIQLLLFVTALTLTRNVWDGFQIRKELFVALLLQFAFFTTHIIAIYEPDSPLANMAMELACIRSTLFFHISIAVPLYESYSITQLPVIPTNSVTHDGMSLLDIITHVDYHTFFQDFMVEQRHDALWNFWVAVELFKDIHDDDTRRTHGRELFQTYLSEETLRDGGAFSQWFYLIAHRMGGDCDRELSRITRALYGHDVYDASWNHSAHAARRRAHLSGVSSPSVSSLPSPAHNNNGNDQMGSIVGSPSNNSILHDDHLDGGVGMEASVSVGSLPMHHHHAIESTIFEAFQHTAFMIMKEWCWPVFLTSSYYRQLRDRQSSNVVIQQRLIAADIL